MIWRTKTLICFWLSYVVCCFVLINSVLLNLLCVWILWEELLEINRTDRFCGKIRLEKMEGMSMSSGN